MHNSNTFPQKNLMSSEEAIKYIEDHWTILSAIVAFMATLAAYVWKKRHKISRSIKIISLNFVDFVTDSDSANVASIKTSVEEMSKFVMYELRPNGGKSFRDSLEETKTLMKESVEQITNQGLKIESIVAEQEFLSEIDERGFFKMDVKGNCIIANIKVSKIVGVSINQIAQKEWWALIHPDDIEMLEKQWKFAYEKECDFYSVHRVINRDFQEIRTIEVKAKPYYIRDIFNGFNGVVKLVKTEALEDIHTSISDRDNGKEFWKSRELKVK